MLHAGLDLSRKKLDVCLLSDHGKHLDQLAVPPDVDSLRRLARRIEEVHREPVCAVVESMTGARLVHDTLEAEGWEVEIADAQKVKGGWRRLPARPTGSIRRSWRSSLTVTWCRRSGCPIRGCARSASRALSAPSGQAQVGAQEPGPLDADQLRACVPGHRPVRRRGPEAARAPTSSLARRPVHPALGVEGPSGHEIARRPRGPRP
jgi:hypothetical protein